MVKKYLKKKGALDAKKALYCPNFYGF